MADGSGNVDLNHTNLNLTTEEKRVFGQLFKQADTDNLGVITGEVAVKFFERTKLAPSVLGEIWQIADTENRGLLTPAGFCIVLRLIGHYQAGRELTPDLALKSGPLPRFDGANIPGPAPPSGPPPPTLQPQPTSGPIRVPPLSPEKATEYATLFENAGAQNGFLSGETAKQIFEKARLPNEILGRIWNLADTEQRGSLGVTEFIIAMHLLASYKSRAMTQLPQILPPGLYEAAARRTAPAKPWPVDPTATGGIPRQFSGSGTQRTQSPITPITRPPYGTPPQTAQPTGTDWLINPQEKSKYDSFFSKLDIANRGYITGEQAVGFFSDSSLPEDVLAQIWDLADINSEGQLNRDEFAVAMYLIRTQRGKTVPTLPSALPPNLIPPSMRGQTRPPPSVATTATGAFETPFSAPAPPKSASEDLFGLDAFSSAPPPVQQQSTGGSAGFARPFDDPFGSSKTASPTSPQGAFQPTPRNPANVFKPFMPTSTFGQTLTSQTTGGSASSLPQARGAPSQAATQPSAMEDLLGEVDPEVSKKLTQETAELANMSSQVGTLKNQMQDLSNRKSATANDLSTSTTQRQELEQRLAHFRAQYEQEVKSLKNLEERLTASRNETRKLQSDIAMLEGTFADLQNQHRQVSAAFESDQRENNALKEKMRQVNHEISQLKPQLEKLRSDARQQKGLVAINKKQLATNEGERDKVKSEIGDLNKAAQERQAAAAELPSPSAVASPAASTTSQSTNPFFRRSPQPNPDNAMSPSGFSPAGPPVQAQSNFDNIFGPSFSTAQGGPPPSTSFKSPEPSAPSFSAPSGQSVRSSEGLPTPSTSPPLSAYHESPRVTEPPPPPESQQIKSSFLPFREPLNRNESMSSSVKVSAPASRYDESETPRHFGDSSSATPNQGTQTKAPERPEPSRPETNYFGQSAFDRKETASPAASTTSDANRSLPRPAEERDIFQSFGSPAIKEPIPGSFPDLDTPMQATPTGESTMSELSKASNKPSDSAFTNNRADPFPQASRAPTSSKTDFDAAFAGFGPPKPFQERQHTGGSSAEGSVTSAGQAKFNREFPPIEEFGHDESDSASERGFEDNFTSASPPQKRSSAVGQGRPQTESRPATSGDAEDAFVPRPTVVSIPSTATDLPTPNAQKSPPSYDQVAQSNSQSNGSRFPPEFGGLLPSREDPTSPPGQHSAPQISSGQALFGGPSVSEAPVQPTYGPGSGPGPSTQAPQVPKPSFGDDFDTGFDDLDEAKEADNKDDDDFMISSHHGGFEEFNPVFDSPINSKTNTMASQQTPSGRPMLGDDSFNDFEHNIGSSSHFGQAKAPQQPTATQSHDWDAIFSNMDSHNNNSIEQSTHRDVQGESSASAAAPKQSNMPSLGRTMTTEHDDPILKQLTGMGYNRQDALEALEKYDYDIDKAADYLTSGHH